MVFVKAKDKESFERLFGRFKRLFNQSGLLTELKDRERYTKPTTKRRMKKKLSELKQKYISKMDKK